MNSNKNDKGVAVANNLNETIKGNVANQKSVLLKKISANRTEK